MFSASFTSLLTDIFVYLMAIVAPLARRCANAIDSSSSAARDTTCVTRPIRNASSAPTGSPVIRNRFATAGPTARGQITTPPSPATRPTRTWGSPIRAVSAMNIVSQSRATEAPRPMAWPLSAHTIGNSMSRRSQMSAFASRRRWSSFSVLSRVGNQVKSPPAQNAFFDPVSRIALASRSCCSRSNRSANCE